jgi:cytochrome d ubiquinol oxidase subunit I
MEGRFETGPRAGLNMIGQPNVEARRLDNPVTVPDVLSILAFGHVASEVQGLNDFAPSEWPDNVELLYYSFHVMAGLGTLLILVMAAANVLAWRGRLEKSAPMLWILMLAFPFPYIAVLAGWMTTELGRQPWLVYGLFRTSQGSSPTVHAGTALFTLLGFCGIYTALAFLFFFLVSHEIAQGPAPREMAAEETAHA